VRKRKSSGQRRNGKREPKPQNRIIKKRKHKGDYFRRSCESEIQTKKESSPKKARKVGLCYRKGYGWRKGDEEEDRV